MPPAKKKRTTTATKKLEPQPVLTLQGFEPQPVDPYKAPPPPISEEQVQAKARRQFIAQCQAMADNGPPTESEEIHRVKQAEDLHLPVQQSIPQPVGARLRRERLAAK